MRYDVFCRKSDLSLSPVCIGCSSDISITHFAGVRDQYIVHYVTKGCGFFKGNKVSAGQGFLISPGTIEEYHADAENPWTLFWIIAYGTDMEKTFGMYNADPDSGIFEYNFTAKLESAFDYCKSHAGQVLGRFEMLRLFCDIMKMHEKAESSDGNLKNSRIYIDYAVEMISREYSRNLKVREICEKLGISEPYLFRLFKEEFGKSPKRYISDLRLSQSKILLSGTDMKIGEVALAVGFEDVLEFSKFFSHNTGISPSGYRIEISKEKR